MPEKSGLQFTSSLTKKEYIAALAYLPVHVIGIPSLVAVLVFGVSDLLTLNIIAYSVGTVYMLALLGKFLRRDFDALCDHPVKFIVEIGVSYGIYYLSNFVIALILTTADSLSNPNNGAVIDMAMESGRQMVIMTVVMAPIVEELMFRAGVFGLLRKYNRVAAYAASMILFSVYHIWAYAISDASYWIYVIQYLPVAFLLCRCYERCNSIWGSIGLHMLVNGMSMWALNALSNL